MVSTYARRICVFSGSNNGRRPVYAERARELGRLLAERGIGLVFGGSGIGLMGEVANAALAAGGEVIGVIPEPLVRKEIAHQSLTELRVVGSMHERKAMMAELSDGFIALPGGLGTFEELFEIVTWAQLGLHGKPMGLLNSDGYYDPLLRLIEHATVEGFIAPGHSALMISAMEPELLLEMVLHYQPPVLGSKWIRSDQT